MSRIRNDAPCKQSDNILKAHSNKMAACATDKHHQKFGFGDTNYEIVTIWKIYVLEQKMKKQPNPTVTQNLVGNAEMLLNACKPIWIGILMIRIRNFFLTKENG